MMMLIVWIVTREVRTFNSIVSIDTRIVRLVTNRVQRIIRISTLMVRNNWVG